MIRRDGESWSSAFNGVCFCVFGDGDGYLSGEDVRGGCGGVGATADRNGGGVLIGDEGGDGGKDAGGGGGGLEGGGGRAVTSFKKDLSSFSLNNFALAGRLAIYVLVLASKESNVFFLLISTII